MAPKKKTQSSESVDRAAALASELGALLPAALESLSAQRAQIDNDLAGVAAREAQCAAREKSADERELALASREAACAAATADNERRATDLGTREQDLLRKQKQWSATTKGAAPPRSADGKVDSLQMQVLARATATALLKHGLAAAKAARAATD